MPVNVLVDITYFMPNLETSSCCQATGTGDWEWGMGIGDWGLNIEYGEWGMGNGEWELGKWEIENSSVPGDDSIILTGVGTSAIR